MAKMELTIDSENAAFSTPEEAQDEISRLLREASDKVAEGYTSGYLFDYNGNRCGHWWADLGED